VDCAAAVRAVAGHPALKAFESSRVEDDAAARNAASEPVTMSNWHWRRLGWTVRKGNVRIPNLATLQMRCSSTPLSR
jgi:hypothetical protein